MRFAVLASFAFAALSGVATRQITVYNACPFTIWPAMYTNNHIGGGVPSQPTGWEAPAWSVKTFGVPENWMSARIWGRRNCDFSRPGPNNCLTGGCNGGLECDRESGTGVPPATLAEFNFDGSNDWYDVSLVDGANLPMRITNTAGCPVAECPVDLGPNCPPELKGPFDASGFPVGCKSYCKVTGDPAACCTGSHSTAETCPNTGVKYYSYFKTACPNSYVHAYDEPSGRALYTCPTGRRADYTITFCP
ncbi:thaumatin-like protein [Ephemerocybe angulata]|uniref:Thaumatin-like protein n=1 Tax=Ephemerocybe angulata TaxID=980116 RepID=A0A8H6LYK5_9AGAR|nr:thaumatin-like protein [Tulosesus angulatus]